MSLSMEILHYVTSLAAKVVKTFVSAKCFVRKYGKEYQIVIFSSYKCSIYNKV